MNASTRVLELRRLAGNDLTPLGVAEPLTAPRVFRGGPDATWDWVILPIDDDPLFKHATLGVPEPVRDKLLRLHKLGVDFDSYIIGHEVPKGSLPDKPSPTDVHTVLVTLAKKAAGAHVAPVDATIGVLSAVLKAAVVGTVAAIGAGAALIAEGALAGLADPVLIGALHLNPTDADKGRLCAYFEIARW